MKKLLLPFLALTLIGAVPGCKKKEPKKEKMQVETMVDVDWQIEEEQESKSEDTSKF